MSLSNLTSSEAEILAEIANAAGASVSAKTHSPAAIYGAWYAAVVGGSNPYRQMSIGQMVAGIRNEIVGGSKSHLNASVNELLADIASEVSGTTVSRFSKSPAALLAIVSSEPGSNSPPDPVEGAALQFNVSTNSQYIGQLV